MTILDEICSAKRTRVAQLKREQSWADLESEPNWIATRRSLSKAMRRPDGEEMRFLCEIKRASPSAGWIRPGADAVEVGRIYESAGASAISLLTEEEYFRGELTDLPRVRELGLPVLMKDFFIDPYQVALGRGLGADAILLIAAVNDRPMLLEVRAAAGELGLDVLVEVHHESECDLAHELEPDLIGVNHRNLRTFEVDLATSARLKPYLPEATRLAESGIKTREDVVLMKETGFDGCLVGESLMREEDPGAALRRLRGESES